eukprot:jgi/Tetstr1/440784/TSEL_029092.t1
MWTHRLHAIINKYPDRMPPSAFQDCHARNFMDVNDITITELEHLRPVTLIVSGPPCQPWSRAGSRLRSQDHRSRAFASVIGFVRFYLTTPPKQVRYIVENVPGALDFPEILSSLGTGNILRATACGSPAHRDTLMWTNIAPQPDIQNYVSNINAIELTDPGPCAWDLCLYLRVPPLYSSALRARAMGFTLDDLPTSHPFEAALRDLLGGVIDLNVMRNYIKAVSGAATAKPVTTVCHISHGISINSDGEAWVLIDSCASSHVNAHRTDYIYYMVGVLLVVGMA